MTPDESSRLRCLELHVEHLEARLKELDLQVARCNEVMEQTVGLAFEVMEMDRQDLKTELAKLRPATP